jgi:hypothetical protein
VTREEILSKVEDYRAGLAQGDEDRQGIGRRKFERDKRELRELGIVIEPEKKKVAADHTGGEVEAYLLRSRDLYLPYLELSSGPRRVEVAVHAPRDLAQTRGVLLTQARRRTSRCPA